MNTRRKFELTFDELCANFENKVYHNTDPYPQGRLLPDTYLFNPLLSTQLNEKLVAESNAALLDAQKLHQENTDYLEKLLRKDTVAAIMTELELSEKQAIIVEELTYEEMHSSLDSFINSINKHAVLVKRISLALE